MSSPHRPTTPPRRHQQQHHQRQATDGTTTSVLTMTSTTTTDDEASYAATQLLHHQIDGPSLSSSSASSEEEEEEEEEDQDQEGEGEGDNEDEELDPSLSTISHAHATTTHTPANKKPPPTYTTLVHAIVRGCLVIAMSFGINILNLLIYLTIRPWSRVHARRLTGEWWQTMWVSVMAYLLPKSEIVLTGDALHPTIDTTRPAIIIANHQVDADWWYCWEFARAYGLQGRLKIILKADLKKIPVVGWGMRQFEFLFLERNWQADKRKMYRLLGSFVEDGYECALLIFPEGTTINTKTFEKSKGFAAETSRPELKHLVLPRITGFAACLDALSQTGLTPIIYDLTIAYNSYTGEIPTWEMGYGRSTDTDIPNVEDMLRGRACERVHVHVKKYEGGEEVLGDVQGWLDARWKEKDAMLESFIQEKSFIGVGGNGEGKEQQSKKEKKENGSTTANNNTRTGANGNGNGTHTHPAEDQITIHPEGSLVSLLFLLFLPLLIALLLPAILLLTLIAWPIIVLAGAINFLKLVGRSALGAVQKTSSKKDKVKRVGSRRNFLHTHTQTQTHTHTHNSSNNLSGAGGPASAPGAASAAGVGVGVGVGVSDHRYDKDTLWGGSKTREEGEGEVHKRVTRSSMKD